MVLCWLILRGRVLVQHLECYSYVEKLSPQNCESILLKCNKYLVGIWINKYAKMMKVDDKLHWAGIHHTITHCKDLWLMSPFSHQELLVTSNRVISSFSHHMVPFSISGLWLRFYLGKLQGTYMIKGSLAMSLTYRAALLQKDKWQELLHTLIPNDSPAVLLKATQ